MADSEGTEGDKREQHSYPRIFRSRIVRAVFLSSVFLPAVAVTALHPRYGETSPAPDEAAVPASPLPVADRMADAFRFIPDMPKETRLSRENRSDDPDDSAEAVLAGGIRGIVSGYPIEAMADDIAHFDREVAALIVGIAKKESDWGRRSPRDASGDCFNYWGYKGSGGRGSAMGYACFDSRGEAVRAVGGRIAELVAARQASDPERLVVWKCGSSCAGHDPEGVRKWIADVRHYYEKVMRG